MISIILAVDKKYLIGNGDKLPWPNLSADMAYFKKVTKGKVVVMGRKTYFSLPETFRPLSGRKNVVLSGDKNLKIKDVDVINNISQVKTFVKKDQEIFIIGGAQVYKLALEEKIIERIYLTEIDGEFEGDTYFSSEFLEYFKEISRRTFLKNEKNSHNMDFVIYERNK